MKKKNEGFNGPNAGGKIDYHEHETLPDISNVASAQECTGLMHKSPRSLEELENYQELSSMAIPKEKRSR